MKSTAAPLAMLLALGAGACAHHARPAAMAPAPAPVAAVAKYQTQVKGSLGRLTVNAKSQGYGTQAAEPMFGRLGNHETASQDLVLVGGKEYALMAVCDSDCADVDLKVFDTEGTLVLQDVSGDATPVLTFTANTTGRYRADVIMASCSHDPCYYGLQLLAK